MGMNKSASSALATARLLLGEAEAEKTVAMAVENGINYFDMAAGDATPFPAYGRAVSGCRDKVFFQVHFGADYRSGKYGWTLDLDEIKRSIDWPAESPADGLYRLRIYPLYG